MLSPLRAPTLALAGVFMFLVAVGLFREWYHRHAARRGELAALARAEAAPAPDPFETRELRRVETRAMALDLDTVTAPAVGPVCDQPARPDEGTDLWWSIRFGADRMADRRRAAQLWPRLAYAVGPAWYSTIVVESDRIDRDNAVFAEITRDLHATGEGWLPETAEYRIVATSH